MHLEQNVEKLRITIRNVCGEQFGMPLASLRLDEKRYPIKRTTLAHEFRGSYGCIRACGARSAPHEFKGRPREPELNDRALRG